MTDDFGMYDETPNEQALERDEFLEQDEERRRWKFTCYNCGHVWKDYWFRGADPICPKCGS